MNWVDVLITPNFARIRLNTSTIELFFSIYFLIFLLLFNHTVFFTKVQ